jgi:hypothetical protein
MGHEESLGDCTNQGNTKPKPCPRMQLSALPCSAARSPRVLLLQFRPPATLYRRGCSAHHTMTCRRTPLQEPAASAGQGRPCELAALVVPAPVVVPNTRPPELHKCATAPWPWQDQLGGACLHHPTGQEAEATASSSWGPALGPLLCCCGKRRIPMHVSAAQPPGAGHANPLHKPRSGTETARTHSGEGRERERERERTTSTWANVVALRTD